jgi:hypothetical protein
MCIGELKLAMAFHDALDKTNHPLKTDQMAYIDMLKNFIGRLDRQMQVGG